MNKKKSQKKKKKSQRSALLRLIRNLWYLRYLLQQIKTVKDRGKRQTHNYIQAYLYLQKHTFIHMSLRKRTT